MTAFAAALRAAVPSMGAGEAPELAAADLVVAPTEPGQVAAVLQLAGEHGAKVLVWGGGTHQGLGGRVDADVVMSTHRLAAVIDHRPDDLTVVVDAGVPIAALEERLAGHAQTAVLTERPGRATVGGAVAAGVSGWRRLRYGPTRERVLEVTLVTGDGRMVRGGGRVVKNVTGYDLPRLATGSFGSLGVIVSVCLKLWPVAPAAATVTVADPEEALARAYRPLAVIEHDGGSRVYLSGFQAEVEAQAETLGGPAEAGLHWPDPLPGPVQLLMRVPPADTRAAVGQVPAGWGYQAAHGVGEVTLSAPDVDDAALASLREWAESRGGVLVVAGAPAELYERFDPWGTPPATLDIQRRIVGAFDPTGTINPGRPAGGL